MNRMNASDIIKKKQNTCLYRAYYNPVVYQSTVFSTLNPFSTISSGTASYTSTVAQVNNYVCPPHILSYNLINNIMYGKFSSGDKSLSELEWKNTNSTVQYYYSTNIVTSSYVLSGPEPVICPDIQFNTYACGGGGVQSRSGDNASDIVIDKRDGTLYKAYYTPRVFQSTIVSTFTPFSSISSGTVSYTSSFETIYTYECKPKFISYQIANEVNNGAYVCGNKQISELEWNNTTSSLQFYFSTSGVGGISTITSSFVLRGPEPIIYPLVQFYQGVETVSNCCDSCEGCDEGVILYCDYIDSGY
jgi:hypothetical protein